MRFLSTSLLVLVMAFFGATSASAYAFNMSVRGGASVTSLTTSDTITVDIFMDADSGLQILGLGVLVGDVISYDIVASGALPIIYPAPPANYGTTGAAPGYILYTAGMPATSVYPLQNPPKTWPSPPTDSVQVNVNYAEGAINPAVASGSNIWIASLVFHVGDTSLASTEIAMTLEAGGNVLRSDDVEIDPANIPLSAPIQVTFAPEPTVASLAVAACVVTAYLARRRRA